VNWIWFLVFITSAGLLLTIVLRNRAGRGFVKFFSLNVVLGMTTLFLLNLFEVMIALNLATLGTALILGLPGIGLLLALQQVLF
jgi:inhibitor of the pro-sigma K processing machinery